MDTDKFKRMLTGQLWETQQNYLGLTGGDGAMHATKEIGEHASDTVQAGTNIRLSSFQNMKQEAIQEALGRIDAGTYGICRDCGKPISEPRLIALPFAVRCIDCQSKSTEPSPNEVTKESRYRSNPKKRLKGKEEPFYFK